MVRRSAREILNSHLNDILAATIHAQNFVSGMTLEEFISDQEAIFAVSRCFDIMGKKANLIQRLRHIKIPELPYNDMIGAARYLNHHYRAVNPEILWISIERDIEKIEKLVRNALGDNINPSVPKRIFKYPRIKLIPVNNHLVLTADVLSSKIVPFVDALKETQWAIDVAFARPLSTVQIQTISQQSPIIDV